MRRCLCNFKNVIFIIVDKFTSVNRALQQVHEKKSIPLERYIILHICAAEVIPAFRRRDVVAAR